MYAYIYCHRCGGYIGCTNDLNFYTYSANHECKEA